MPTRVVEAVCSTCLGCGPVGGSGRRIRLEMVGRLPPWVPWWLGGRISPETVGCGSEGGPTDASHASSSLNLPPGTRTRAGIQCCKSRQGAGLDDASLRNGVFGDGIARIANDNHISHALPSSQACLDPVSFRSPGACPCWSCCCSLLSPAPRACCRLPAGQRKPPVRCGI